MIQSDTVQISRQQRQWTIRFDQAYDCTERVGVKLTSIPVMASWSLPCEILGWRKDLDMDRSLVKLAGQIRGEDWLEVNIPGSIKRI